MGRDCQWVQCFFGEGSVLELCSGDSCLREREIDFKELSHRAMGADKSKICRMGQQPGDPGKSQYL